MPQARGSWELDLLLLLLQIDSESAAGGRGLTLSSRVRVGAMTGSAIRL